MSGRTYLTLQYARGMAALAVVYYHAVISSAHVFGLADNTLPRLGATGVDLFFVLSGFVIWASTASRPPSPAAFLQRRLIRIVPLYWSCTLLVAAVALAAPSLLRATVLEPVHFLASLFFVPWPNPAAADGTGVDPVSPLLVPGWTLNFEMIFYLLFALALAAPAARRLGLFLALVSGVALTAWMLSGTSEVARFLHPARLLEFAAGVLLARWSEHGLPRLPRGVGPVLAGIGVLAMGLAEFHRFDGWPFATGAAATAIVFALVAGESRRGAPSWPLLRRIGDASYSIYLTHIFVVAALRPLLSAWARSGFAAPVMAMQIAYVLLCVAVATLVGLAVHYGYDAPVVRRLSQRGHSPVPVSAQGDLSNV